MIWRWRRHLQSGDEHDDGFFPDKQDKVETSLESSGQRVKTWHLEHFNDSPLSHLHDSCMELLWVAEAYPFHLTSTVKVNLIFIFQEYQHASRSLLRLLQIDGEQIPGIQTANPREVDVPSATQVSVGLGACCLAKLNSVTW